ncbi:MAG: hypothetical protein JEZ11_27440 [Desulfobacterales bacterium]|nr:hypothetical protein [Desulfobacterales bacterium]
MNCRHFMAWGLVFAAVMILTACFKPESMVTRENYDRLELGMTDEAVTGILGDPGDTGTSFGVRYCTWIDGERHIHAKFLTGRVVYYSSKGLEETPTHGAR